MSEWIPINDSKKPEFKQEVLIRIPVCSYHNVMSANYIGDNTFIDCWGSRKGDKCTYTVSHWQVIPLEPTK